MPHSSKIRRIRGFTHTFVQAAPAGACSVLRMRCVRWRGVGASCIARSVCHQPAMCSSPFDFSLSVYLPVAPVRNDGPRWGTGGHTYHPLKEDHGLRPPSPPGGTRVALRLMWAPRISSLCFWSMQRFCFLLTAGGIPCSLSTLLWWSTPFFCRKNWLGLRYVCDGHPHEHPAN